MKLMLGTVRKGRPLKFRTFYPPRPLNSQKSLTNNIGKCRAFLSPPREDVLCERSIKGSNNNFGPDKEILQQQHVCLPIH